MLAANSLLNPRKFLPLFAILFLNASSDHILRNATIVMLAYQGVCWAGMSSIVAVNIFTLVFILPFFLFSSYAGKLADATNKVTLIKRIKYYELLIVVVAGIGFYYRSPWLMLLALFSMGIHSTFFGPIKYSILPEYLTVRKQLLLANGYVELGTFIATLAGQMLGSWYMAKHAPAVVLALMAGSALVGLSLSYRLADNRAETSAAKPLTWNFPQDICQTYREVITSVAIRNNLHAISWFWALGIIYTTQLPMFILKYMGGSAAVFSFLLAVFSIAIGIGSLVCAKLSNGQINKAYVVVGASAISIFSLALILLNHQPKTTTVELMAFSQTATGFMNFGLIFLVGFFSGFYSVTCYNELQLIVAPGSLSRVIAVNNILNAAYMVVAALVCTLLLLIMDLRSLFMIFIVANSLFVIWYWRSSLSRSILVA